MELTETIVAEPGERAGVQPVLRSRSRWHVLWFWVKRYAPPEICGTATMVLCGMAVAMAGAPAVVVGMIAAVAESVGFYMIAGVVVWREQRRNVPYGRRLRILVRVFALLLAEFGPAELLDTLLVRPGALTAALLVVPNVAVALVAGKVIADIVFYVLAATAFRVTEKAGLRGEAE